MLMPLRPPAQLLSPWLQRGAVALLHAQPKTGKTYLALAVALAVANGAPLLGWQPSKPGRPRRVLYLDAEMPRWLLKKRLMQLGSDSGDVAFMSREALILNGDTMPDLGSDEGREDLSALVEEFDPDLIVLDSLSALIRTGDENERGSWLPIEDWLQEQRARSRAVLMVHHQGKSGLQRGTSAREEVLDSCIAMTKHSHGSLRLTIERLRDHDGPVDRTITARLDIEAKTARWRKVGKAKTDDGDMSDTRSQVLTLKKQDVPNGTIARRLRLDRKTVYDHVKRLEGAGLV